MRYFDYKVLTDKTEAMSRFVKMNLLRMDGMAFMCNHRANQFMVRYLRSIGY